ncbi:MAG: hypothetical protein HYY17_11820 [Planctomycetes bacterium]|nr:hypothetical protein [Planctomycetota bacterium]
MRFLGSLTGLYVGLLVALAPALAQEGKKGDTVRIRLLDKREETVEVVDWDEKGIRVKLKDVPAPVTYEWWKLDPESAQALKKRYLGKIETPAEEGVTLDGVRVKTATRTVEGVVVPEGPPDEIRIKNAEGTWVFKLADVVSKEPVKLRIHQVYGAEELYRILMDRVRPSEAEEWDRLGAELIRAGLRDRAVHAFNMGELLRRAEFPEGRLLRDILRLRERLEDIALRRSVLDVQERFLSGRYQEAIDLIDLLEPGIKDAAALREVRRIRTELLQLRDQSREETIVAEWARAMDSHLRLKAYDPAVGFEDATAYVRQTLGNDVLRSVNERLNITRGDTSARIVWERRSARAVFKHAYGDASWIVVRPELGSAHSWWASADAAAKFRLLKGVAIEALLSVVRIAEKNCPTCGGTGAVDPSRFPEAAAGICPTCRGLKHERTVFYR